FVSKDVPQRREIVKTKGLCWNCLNSSHQVKSCKSDYSCRSCHERHHSLLHHALQPKEDLALQACHEWNKAQSVSTLGLIWEPAEDSIRFRIELPPAASSLTRRLVLSYIAKIFDILGVLGPTIVLAKLFMQQLWSLKAK
uniref:Uncharacterized protein n=1 Tax=Anopheles dirus TaxID=7168 RepID=A0A182NCB7_9DIPT